MRSAEPLLDPAGTLEGCLGGSRNPSPLEPPLRLSSWPVGPQLAP